MTLHYTVTEEEYVNFNLFHQQHSEHAKRVNRVNQYGLALSIFVIILAVLYAQGIQDLKDLVVALVIALVTAVLWIVYCPHYYQNAMRKNVKKMMQEGNNDFIGKQTLTLMDDKFEGISSITTSYTTYAAIERIGVGYNCFFIYIGSIKAYIVPFSAFEDKSQQDEFIRILQEKTGIQPLIV